jgi:hypothetical protein
MASGSGSITLRPRLDLITANSENPIFILVLLLLFQFHSPDGIIIVMYYFNSFSTLKKQKRVFRLVECVYTHTTMVMIQQQQQKQSNHHSNVYS